MATMAEMTDCAHGNHEFQGRDGEELDECLHCGFEPEDEPATEPMTVWIVEGEHFDVPGRMIVVCATAARADIEAAKLVEELVASVNEMAAGMDGYRTVDGGVTPENWRERLKEAQKAEWAADTPEDDMDPTHDFEDLSSGYVMVTKCEVVS